MVTFLGIAVLFVSVGAVEHDLEYLAALRKDSFYRLAHAQGQQMLSAELTAEQRSRIVVEISKTHAAQALNSRQPERGAHWKDAVEVLQQELRSASDPALAVLLRSQLAFIQQQQAEWNVREAEIRSASDSDWETARTQLRTAIKSLKQLEQDFVAPAMRRQQTLPAPTILEIQRNVRYQLAQAYLHQAIAYPNSPTDRTNALTSAMAFLEPLATGREQDELVWKSRIDRVRCLRLLGQYKQTQQLIGQLSSAPAEHIGVLAAESIRLALDARSLESAMRLASNEHIDAKDPEFQLARVQAFVAMVEQLKGQPKAEAFQQQAVDTVATLAEEHGIYWGLRGEILLSRLATGDDASVGLLGNAAETMLRRDSPESAKEMFQRAAQQAESDDEAKAFEFSFKAAAVDHREGNFQPAIDGFRSVSTKYPRNAKAAEAHLMAVFDAAALFQEHAATKSSTLNDSLTQYEELLAEHIRFWPNDSTADQARVWAGRLALAKRLSLQAIQLYQGVRVGSKLELEAYQGLEEAYRQWFVSGRSTDQELNVQRAWLQSRLAGLSPSSPRAFLATLAARLCMQYAPRDYARAEAILHEAQADLAADQRAAQDLGALLVVAAAGNGDAIQARRRLAQIAPVSLEAAITTIRGLEPIRDQRPNDVALRELTLELIGVLTQHKDHLSPGDLLSLQLATADSSDPQTAILQYREFSEQYPTDLRIQRRYAKLLLADKTHVSQQLALHQWRGIVKKTRPRTSEWFEAKLGVAESHFGLGERKKTKEVIEYLEALYPDLGGNELKSQFQQLLARCGP